MSKITFTTREHQIEYEELPWSNQESDSTESQSRARLLAVAWEHKEVFKFDMLGLSQNLGGSLSRITPESHPENNYMFCVSCELHAFEGQTSQDQTTGMAQAETARYLCAYRRLPWRVKSDDDVDSEKNRNVWRTTKYAFEQQRIQNQSQFVWVAPGKSWDNQPLEEVPAKPIVFQNLTYIIRDVPYELVPDFVSLANKVNDSTFDDAIAPGEINLGGFPEGVAMLMGVETFDHWGINDILLTDLTYSVGIHPIGWNYFLGPDARFYNVVMASDATKGVFETADLNQLFEFIET